jgi:quercetin dioxygenase-like cupin family protein
MIKAKAVDFDTIPAREFGPEAPGTSIRVLISDAVDGAPVYNMRMIEIQPGGHSPDHAHPYEHENYVLEGEGEVMIGERVHPIHPGTVILVPPDVRHQYRNTGGTLLRFLCSVPVEKLRTS